MLPRKLEPIVVDWSKEPEILPIPRAGRILCKGPRTAYRAFLHGEYQHLVVSFGERGNFVPRDWLRKFLEGELVG